MEVTDYCFSFFRKPIQNTEPLRAIGIVDVYRYVVGHYARPQTEALRSMVSPADAKRYKAAHFDYCTFSGLFRKRNEKELIMHSGLMCLDFDHVEDMESVKQQLLNHDYFDTELLFTSPSYAAMFVIGKSANGLTSWKTSDGKTLKSLEETTEVE